jgi:hypothetical protein
MDVSPMTSHVTELTHAQFVHLPSSCISVNTTCRLCMWLYLCSTCGSVHCDWFCVKMMAWTKLQIVPVIDMLLLQLCFIIFSYKTYFVLVIAL